MEGLVEGSDDKVEEGGSDLDFVRSLAQRNNPGDFLCAWRHGTPPTSRTYRIFLRSVSRVGLMQTIHSS